GRAGASGRRATSGAAPRRQLPCRRLRGPGDRLRPVDGRGDPARGRRRLRTAIQALSVLLPSGYVLAAILHGMAFGGAGAPQVAGLRRAVLTGPLLVHFAFFFLRAEALGHFPVSEVWSTLSAVALSAAALYVVVAGASGRSPSAESHTGTGGVVL